MAFIVGLTGGIAAGKSLASSWCRDHNIPVVDADAISRALTDVGGRAIPIIAEKFGADMIQHGKMNRQAMRELVFRQPVALKLLENILHPMIQEEVDSQIQHYAKDHDIVVYDCPLLLESEDLQTHVDRILLIDACDSTRITRLVKRPGINHDMAERIMSKQSSRAMKLSRADDVIVNEGTPQELFSALEAYFASIRETPKCQRLCFPV